ncbi:flagellar biosynthesis protein FlgL, partial [Corynebacterium propinquum]
ASSTQYSVTDKDGNDVTSEIPGNGTFDATKEGASSVNLRGAKFDISLNLGASVAPGAASDALVAGKVFTLETKPDTFSVSRTASNPSTAQLTGGSVTDQAAYARTLPDAGAVIKLTSGTDYQVFAQPYGTDSKAIASGTIAAGATSVTTAGVTFGISGTPGAGDQFSVGATSNKNMNALDTLGQLRKALETPSDGSQVAMNQLKDVVNTSIANLANATAQIDQVRGSIGARNNALDIQSQENTSLGLANTTTMSSLANVDMGQAAIDLTLQQTMLQASQLAFVKISQLSLFSRM